MKERAGNKGSHQYATALVSRRRVPQPGPVSFCPATIRTPLLATGFRSQPAEETWVNAEKGCETHGAKMGRSTLWQTTGSMPEAVEQGRCGYVLFTKGQIPRSMVTSGARDMR